MSEFDNFIVAGDGPVEEFARACEETANVKFILAERKISELLMLIATSEKLSDVVARASSGFDFAATLKSSRIRTGKHQSLLPPVGRKELIAFAVNLLYAFDVRAVLLQDFLEEYFYSANGINFSFSLFAHSIILPLRDSIVDELAEEEAARSVEDLPPHRETNDAPAAEGTDETESVCLPEDAATDFIDRIADICDIAKASGELTDAELKDLYDVAGGVAGAVQQSNAQLIRALMTGFGAVVRAGRMADELGEKVLELDETLTHFGI